MVCVSLFHKYNSCFFGAILCKIYIYIYILENDLCKIVCVVKAAHSVLYVKDFVHYAID